MDNHDFTSDRPILSVDDDLLDRGRFAKSLSKAISGWKGKDSLTIALHGDWGSGKSSIKNMTLSAFSNLGIETPEVIEFNPWEWAGQDRISKSFFEELASSIGQVDKSKKRKKLAKKIKLYGLYLNSGATFVSGFTSALPTLFILAAIFGFGNFTNKQWMKEISTLLLAITVGWAAFLKWGGKLAGQLSGIAEEHANQAELSLDKLKSSLREDLKNLERPLLIVIDDIDRLTTGETRMIFQLVKANADFPNVVYLLLFQRDAVEIRLTDSTQQGRDYLEKIIQVPFDIPRIEQARLEKILFASLDRILEEDPKILKRFDQTRWGNVFYGGLRPFFKTLRNVYRYSATLSFYVSLLKGTKSFEVNPIDLIVIECLRVFEPDVYKAISLSKNLLTTTNHDQHKSGSIKNELQKIIEQSTEEARESIIVILKQIFPTIEGVLGGANYGGNFNDNWFKDLRICHPAIFDRYFQFSIPVNEVSQSDLDELIELSADLDELLRKLISLKDNGQLKAALSQLDFYKQDIPLQNSDTFIPALMCIGDEVENESGGFTGFSTHTHVVRIVLWYLRQDESIDSRGERLISAFDKATGLSIMARLLSGDEKRREKEDKSELILLSDVYFEMAKIKFVEKLRHISSSEPIKLLNNKYLAAILYNWGRWGQVSEIESWINSVLNNYQDLLVFLDSFTTQVISQTAGDYVARIKHKITLGSVVRYMSVDKIKELLEGLDKEILSDRQKQVVEALYAALDRRAKGYADDAWDDD